MARKKNAAPAALDLSNLDLGADAAMPEQTRVVENRKWDNNPFVEPLRAMNDAPDRATRGRQMTVPAHHAREIAAGIRDAADKLNIGARIIFTRENGDRFTKVTEVPEGDEPITILYGAKDRRRSLNVEQSEEAVREGFVNPETGRVQVRPYLLWVEAGRPREDAEHHEG